MAIEQVYGEMDLVPRPIARAQFEGKQVMHVPGFRTIWNGCKMDASSYSMTILDCIVMLV